MAAVLSRQAVACFCLSTFHSATVLQKLLETRRCQKHMINSSASQHWQTGPLMSTLTGGLGGLFRLQNQATAFTYLGCVAKQQLVNADNQWRNYERRSEAIASGRQAAGGAFGRRIVCFALQNSAKFLKRERS